MEKKEKKQTSFRMFWNRLKKNKLAMVGGVIFLLIILVSVFADVIAPYDWAAIDPANKYAPMSLEHPFGTDMYGRDIFSRVIYGGRWSLTLGVAATLLSNAGGIVVGAIAGYFGGKVDAVIMRFIDVLQCIPGILLTICIATVLGTGLFNTVFAMSFGGIWGAARMLRGNILTVRGQEYVEAAKTTNVSQFRIITRYILPNSIQPTIVNMCMGIGGNIMGAAGLSFLGLGIQAPNPEWGAMLNDSRVFMRYYPQMMIAPLIMIALTVLSVSLLGDGVRDAMDPRMND